MTALILAALTAYSMVTHDGVTFRVNRCEDLGLKPHARYRYAIRLVYKDGCTGPVEEVDRR